jgi:hypothetical protein
MLVYLSARPGSGSWAALSVVLVLLAPLTGWLMAINTRWQRATAQAVTLP